MSPYAIMAIDDEGRPTGYGQKRGPFYAVRGYGMNHFVTDIGEATKFSAVPDAVLWQENNDEADRSVILGVLPSVLAEAEARAQHAWNHRNCLRKGERT